MNGESCILKIDPEFRRLVFPLSPEEYAALERRILQHGCGLSWPGTAVSCRDLRSMRSVKCGTLHFR